MKNKIAIVALITGLVPILFYAGAVAHVSWPWSAPNVSLASVLWDCAQFGAQYERALLIKCMRAPETTQADGLDTLIACIESNYGNGDDAKDVMLYGTDAKIKEHASEYVAWCFNDGSVGGAD